WLDLPRSHAAPRQPRRFGSPGIAVQPLLPAYLPARPYGLPEQAAGANGARGPARGKTVRVLLVKTSSMGDVIHTLPALTDAMMALPDIQFDWVVEEAIAAIPAWHPAVDRVIPIALRRWR